MSDRPTPRRWRLALGFVLAPLVPSAALAFAFQFANDDLGRFLGLTMLISLFGPYPTALIVGVPTYLGLIQSVRPRLAWSALAGGAVASTPVVLIGVPLCLTLLVVACVQVAQHQPTDLTPVLAGLGFGALVFGLGSLGGLVFWICVFWLDPRLAAPSQEPGS